MCLKRQNIRNRGINLILDYCSFSEKGTREINQDAVFANAKGGNGLFVVADGMGGHSRGEVASNAVIDALKDWWLSRDDLNDIDEAATSCAEVICNLSEKLYDDYGKSGERGGTTTALLLVNPEQYRVISIGDSRVYRFGTFDFKRVTEDDVWENLPEVKSTLSLQEIQADSRYGMLTAAVGGYRTLSIRIIGGRLGRTEGFLLCSDGTYRPCGDKKLKKILSGNPFFDSVRILEKVRACAIESDTQDNFSAVACRVRKG